VPHQHQHPHPHQHPGIPGPCATTGGRDGQARLLLLLRWRGALTFGFGFAGMLGELQLPAAQFGWALFQFMLGLEPGQLALVFSVVPLLLLLRYRADYVPWVLAPGRWRRC